MVDRHVSLAAAGFVIAGEHRDTFEQGRLSGAVFADDDRDRAIKAQFEIVAQHGKAERIGLAVGDPRWIEPDALQVRRRQVDRAISS